MIKIEANYIYVANIDLADDETIEYYCQNLPEYFGEFIDKTWDNETRLHFLSKSLLFTFMFDNDIDFKRLKYSKSGKPIIASTKGQEPISFSISHSKDWCCFFAAKEKVKLGIDIQYISKLKINKFAKEALGIDHQIKKNNFFALWTKIEAYAKAYDLPLMKVVRKYEDYLSTTETDHFLTIGNIIDDYFFTMYYKNRDFLDETNEIETLPYNMEIRYLRKTKVN